MARIRRILHPSDFSKASAAAFAKAVDLAKSNRAELVVLHVLAPPMPMMAGDGYVSPRPLRGPGQVGPSVRVEGAPPASSRKPRSPASGRRRSCATAWRTSRSPARRARPGRT